MISTKRVRYSKVSINEVPEIPSTCYEMLCEYNVFTVCDNPRKNKGNSDAICSLWANKRMADDLVVIQNENVICANC